VACLRLSAAAQADIFNLLLWTTDRFGHAARIRYEALLFATLADIAADPLRPGSIPRPELGDYVRSYHLRYGKQRARASGAIVARPRHLVLYRIRETGTIDVGRVLHEVMELERHVRFDFPDQ